MIIDSTCQLEIEWDGATTSTPTAGQADPILNNGQLDLRAGGEIVNNGTLINGGSIAPATVALNDNIGFGALTSPGRNPETFQFTNNGTLYNYGYIYGMNDGEKTADATLIAALVGSVKTANDMWLYLYDDGTFVMLLPDDSRLTGTYAFEDSQLIFTLKDGTAIRPEADEDGNSVYAIHTDSVDFEFVLTADFIAQVLEAVKAQ